MKKLMFLFVMMFMTSVSAYSQSQMTEEVIYVDVAVKAPGVPWDAWWMNVPMHIRDHGGIVELILDLDGLIIDHYHRKGNHWNTCIMEMTYYMNALAPRFGVSEFYIAPAGHLPFSSWYY